MQCVSPFNESTTSSSSGSPTAKNKSRIGAPAYTSLDSPSHEESIMKAASTAAANKSINNDNSTTKNTTTNTTSNTTINTATPHRNTDSPYYYNNSLMDRETPTSISNTSAASQSMEENLNNTTFLGQSYSQHSRTINDNNSMSRYNYSQTDGLLSGEDSLGSRGGGATTPSSSAYSSSILTPSSASLASRPSRAVTPTANNTSLVSAKHNGSASSSRYSHIQNQNQSLTNHSGSFLSPTSFANTTSQTPQSSLMDTMHLVSSSDEDEDDDNSQDKGSGDGSTASTESHHNSSVQRERLKWRQSTGAITAPTRDGTHPLRRTAPPQVRQFPSAANLAATVSKDDDEPKPKYYHPAYWNARLARKEIYSKRYRPTNPEQEEMTTLEEWLGIPEARKSRNKTVVVQQWMQLHPSAALAASQNSPPSIVLKRGPVAWSSQKDCELILLTRGFVLARRVFAYIPRFQLGDLWTNVEKVTPTGLNSFAIVCGVTMKTLEFQCETTSEQQAWMNALRVVVLQSYTHSALSNGATAAGGAVMASSSQSQRLLHNNMSPEYQPNDEEDDNPFPLGWQYKLVQTPWFSEAVTGQVRLDSNMLDQMDNRNLNELDSYNQCAPLHYATSFNHVDAMRFLLQAGADPNLVDGVGRTPTEIAIEEELPESTTELLKSYGGKGPKASKDEKRCFFVPVKNTSNRCRGWAILTLLFLLVATGLTTFLIFYLGVGKDNGNSANSIESGVSSSSNNSIDDNNDTNENSNDQDSETSTEGGEDDASSNTPPPFLVVGVNPIPATNLSTLSPFPTFSSNGAPAATPTATSSPLVNMSDASSNPREDELEDEPDFNPDELEETTAATLNPSSSWVTGELPASTGVPTSAPTLTTTDAATLSPTDTATKAVTSAPTGRVTEAITSSATDAVTPAPTQGATSKLTDAATVAATSTPTDSVTMAATTETPAELPTSSPTLGTTLTPTFSPVSDVDSNGVATGPTNFPTFSSLQNQPDEFLPEDVLLFEFLVENSLDGGAALRNPKSVQYEAFRWLSGNFFLQSYSDERRIQRYALATLYFSTKGDQWTNNLYWLSDQDECTMWFSRIAEVATGAICNTDRHMITLDLDYNNLRGTLPQEIALLSHLRRVELYGGPQGFMTGTLPSQIALLTDLESINVRGNRIRGSIPSELGYLLNLGMLSAG